MLGRFGERDLQLISTILDSAIPTVPDIVTVGISASDDPPRFMPNKFSLSTEFENLYQYALSAPVTFIDPSGRKSLTGQEWAVALQHPIDAFHVKGCAEWASANADQLTPARAALWNGTGDALRHCLWNCCIVQKIGNIDEARLFTDAHETGGGFDPTESPMDLFNNAVGLDLGSLCPQIDCISGCQDALNAGKLAILTTVGGRVNPGTKLFPSNGQPGQPPPLPPNPSHGVTSGCC